VGVAYSQTITTSGGTPGYNYTVMAGTLPTGLSLNAATGVLSGTPTGAGVSSFTAKVTDNKSCSAILPLSLSIVQILEPKLTLEKRVSQSTGKPGDLVTYTVILSNTGTGSATGVVVSDTFTAGLSILPGSATASLGTATPGASGLNWTISSLPINTTATLIYSASLSGEGVQYNTAQLKEGDQWVQAEATVCTSIPIQVCAGSNYVFSLTVVAGQTRYQWYRNDVLIQDNGVGVTGPEAYTGTTPHALSVTAAGAYRVVINGGLANQCADGSCCPVVIEEVSIPVSLTLRSVAPTCTGTTPQANGQVLLTGIPNGTAVAGLTYQYSVGGTGFNQATAQPIPASSLPVTGELLLNATGGTIYWVRVSTPMLADGSRCTKDLSIVVPEANCACPPDLCVPITIKKTKSARR
jgi:trimeric autotransporter adhesin